VLDRDAIATAIAGEEPSGPWLRREGTHAAVKEAMKSDPGDPDYGIERKDPDWPEVVSLCSAALARKTKDFYLAHCLLEGLTRTEGPVGLADGLWAIAEIHERFWADFHPRPRDGDLEARVNQLEMTLREWPRVLDAMPVNRSGHESLTVLEWRGADAVAKEAVIRSCSWESLDASVTALKEAAEQLRRLDDLLDKTYENMAPSLGEAKESLGAATRVFAGMLREKGPSPHAERAREVLEQAKCGFLDADWLAERIKGGTPFSRVLNSVQAAAGDAVQGVSPDEGWPAFLDRLWSEGVTYARTTEDPPQPVAPAPVAGAPISMPAGDGGAAGVIGACHAWRLAEPGDPMPYLVLRDIRFGELSDLGPPAGAREQCASLFAAEKWADLAEFCETTLQGCSCAGWLDLHRYSAAAMGRAGAPFGPVRRAVIARIALHLAGKPSLADTVLSDGQPAADETTQNWLKAEVAKSAPAGGPVATNGSADDALREALEVLEGDGLEAAVEQLQKAAASADGVRERALRRRDLGELCLQAKRPEYAAAILESLRDDLHEQRLGLWEGTGFMGRTLEALYRSYDLLAAAQPAEEWAARMRSVADELAHVDLARRIRLETTGSSKG